MEKNSDLLNNLRVEMEDARNGIGKTVEEVKGTCRYFNEALSEIADACNILELEYVKVSNLKILPEHSILFKRLISDLHDKGIIFHRNDLACSIDKKLGGSLNKRSLIIQDTSEPKDLECGRNIVVKDISEFRKYRSYMKEISDIFEFSKQLEKMTVILENRERKYNNQNINEDAIEIARANTNTCVEKLTISLNDRLIKVNDYILSRPHAVGSNMQFFQVVFQNQNIEFNIDELPSMQKIDFEWKKTSKLLNSLGFRGQILKAFFPKRTDKKPRIIKFINPVIVKDLSKRGININLLLKELNLADIRNSPK